MFLNFKKTKRATLFISLFLSCSVNFYLLYSNYNYKKRLIDTNTHIFTQLERMSSLNVHNMDLMMRNSHYINGHTSKSPMCPECGPSEYRHWTPNSTNDMLKIGGGITPDERIEDENVPYRYAQIIQDIDLMELMIDSMLECEFKQNTKLWIQYQKLRGDIPR